VADPTPSRPLIPASYGVAVDGSGAEKLPWSWAVERLGVARNYWVCTTRPDGRPHAAPVWGLWLDDALWFSTGRTSRKARNLERNPAVVIHLESGDETVILEGEIVEVEAEDELERFADAYEAKYDFRPSVGADRDPVFRLRPATGYTWEEKDYPGTAARWLFEQPRR
jgi:PPOX class probable F420-dependent enzyme